MKKTIDISTLDPNKQYTYTDYLTWKFNERVELIKGWLHKMSPAPRRIHQEIEVILSNEIYNFLKKEKCSMYVAPFDVRLKKHKGDNSEINTVIQPDICVVCDLDKLDDAGCLGAPDLIIEILSESTAKKDYNDKFNLYEENGVLEYWIANPATRTLEIYTLEKDHYQLHELYQQSKDKAVVASGKLFPNLKIYLDEVFKEQSPN